MPAQQGSGFRTTRSRVRCSRARRSSHSSVRRISSRCSEEGFSRLPLLPTLAWYLLAWIIWYRSTPPAATFRLFDPTGPRPSDIADTTTGAPYIVRVETGTINRAIYEIAILHDPMIRSGPVDSTAGLERPARLHVSAAGAGGLVYPGRGHGRGAERRACSLAGFAVGLVVAERLRQQLQRRAVGRNDDDGQGALHRSLWRLRATRSAGVLRRFASSST